MVDRRGFFAEAARALGRFGLELIEETPVGRAVDQLEKQGRKWERPPGAVSEPQFSELCTGCDLCMIACPVNVILIDDLIARLPLIYPEEGPCIHCPDTPCISSCPTGALKLL